MVQDKLGPRIDGLDYSGMTGLDYLTGFEMPIERLTVIDEQHSDRTRANLAYLGQFTHHFGINKTLQAPVLLCESSLRVIEKAEQENVPIPNNE